MIERLARRELIAFGTIYRPGSLIPDRVEIRPERWSRFRFVSGNAIRFGPRDRSTVVDKVLIYRASAEVPPPAPGDKAPYGAKKRLLVALIGKHRMTLAGMETRKERAAWLRPKAKCSESTAIQILKEEGL
jgi:hypothetical protein